jgi:hypothetical protein
VYKRQVMNMAMCFATGLLSLERPVNA